VLTSSVGKKRGRHSLLSTQPNAKRLKSTEIDNGMDLEAAMKEVSLADGDVASIPSESMAFKEVVDQYEGAFLCIKNQGFLDFGLRSLIECSRNYTAATKGITAAKDPPI